jgi:ligand-binding sensor domain-containing protein
VDSVYFIGENEYNVEDLSFDDSGNIWIALLGGGLEMFNPVTVEKEFLTTVDGLSNNTTYCILKDKQHNLWISTDNGISRFNLNTRKFRIFGYTDGLKIHEFNSDAAYLAPDGQMFFGGMGGVAGFYPDS